MPTATIPLIGVPNFRFGNDFSDNTIKDQRFINVLFRRIANPLTNNVTLAIERRPGINVHQSNANTGNGVVLVPVSLTSNIYSVAGNNGSVFLYPSAANLGAVTGTPYYITETVLSGITYTVINTSDGTAWFHASNATVTSVTGDTTSGSAVVTNVSANTTGLHAGQAISGTGISAGTRILSVDSSSQITMTANATANGTGVTITVTRLAKIIDSDFPSDAVGPMVHLDGTAYQMTSGGVIHGSDLNTLTAWTANNKITAGSEPDTGVGVFKYRDHIVAFGKSSVEFFTNEGNPTGTLLKRVKGSTILIGCFHARAVAEIDGTLYWISSDFRIYRLNGTEAQRVSTDEIEWIMRANISAIPMLGAFEWGGKRLIILNLDDGNTYNPLVYDVDLNIWCEWARKTAYQNFVRTSFDKDARTVYLAGGDGKVYSVSLAYDVSDESGTAIPVTIRTSKLNFGTNKRKFVRRISLLGTDKQATANAWTLKYSDDDYDNFTTLGTFDETQQNPTIFRCGSYVGARAYELTNSQLRACRAEALEIDYEMGTL